MDEKTKAAAQEAVQNILEIFEKNGTPESVELATADTPERLAALGFETQDQHREALEQVKAELEKRGVTVTIKSEKESAVLRAAIAAHGTETKH